MKSKQWCVTYSYRTHFDTTILAKSKEEAERKVQEVLGDIRIEGTWEVKPRETKAQ